MPQEKTNTYTGNPRTDTKDEVRFLIGDTNPDGNGWLLGDEEILYALHSEGSPYLAAALCAESIAMLPAGLAREIAEKRVGDLVIRYGQGRSSKGTQSGWYLVAKQLRRRANRGALPLAGGIEVSDRQDRTDESLLQPTFTKGQDDNPFITFPFSS